ncbi:hypothetical protein ATANTOWER_015006 [Ataeniobius toweri]|uniref:Uncharacterized protein n=1 Tax=Ataeniobius toweri TaxID=208326 RepID=A0ABU7BE05_9TELE|nr:hypothetical protein [Ataeniobius toweri]
MLRMPLRREKEMPGVCVRSAAAGVQISQAASPLQTQPFRVVIRSIKNSSRKEQALLLMLLQGSFVCFRVERKITQSLSLDAVCADVSLSDGQHHILTNTLHILM